MSSTTNFQKLQFQFASYIRDPENNTAPKNVEPRRMAIYEELFFNNIEGFLRNGFPVIRSLYSDTEWLKIVRDFLRQHRCQSPLFSEIVLEFIDYLSAKGRDLLNRYPFLLELAHYEWVEVSVIYANEENITQAQLAQQQPLSDENWLNKIPQLSSVLHLLAYEYPVHKISSENIPLQKSETGVFLAVYRKLDDEVGFMELNGVSYRLLDAIDGKLTGKEVIDTLAAEMGYADSSELYAPAVEMMNGFLQRNIIVGAF